MSSATDHGVPDSFTVGNLNNLWAENQKWEGVFAR